jgi:hypothetical protein
VSAVHPIAAAASAMAEASSRIGHKVIVRPTDEPPGESRRS